MMLLNEDYFKDIELTDDDITVNDSKEPETVSEIYEQLRSQYTQTIVISFDHPSGRNNKNRKQTLNMLSKTLNYLFDAYNIKHSDMFVVHQDVVMTEQLNELESLDCDGYKLIVPNNVKNKKSITDINEQIAFKNYRYLAYYVKYPDMKYKTSLMFVLKLLNCVWNYTRLKNMFDTGILFTNPIMEPLEFWFSKEELMKRLTFYKDSQDRLAFDDLADWVYFYNIITWFYGKKIAYKMSMKVQKNQNPFDVK